jgi:transposase-like protein
MMDCETEERRPPVEWTPQEEDEYQVIAKELHKWAWGHYADGWEPQPLGDSPGRSDEPAPPKKQRKACAQPKPRKPLAISALEIKAMIDAGQTVREVAAQYDYNRHTIYRALREAGISVLQPCRTCRLPTGGDRRALYCIPCRNKMRREKNRIKQYKRYHTNKEKQAIA